MKTTAQIRQSFLDFFHSKGHQVVESSSLVPENDPTLLFTNAGMNQFKDVFLGLEKRAYSRATTAQRCVRAGGKHNDLENVGYTARHHTFFEMMGNFSFGDYFKQDAIKFGWEYLTSPQWLGLPAEKLYVTVYATDDEAYDIWHKDIGIAADHIIRIGDNKGAPYASDNFWAMGDTGPCGPCTEIFYDHGEQYWGGLPGSPEEDGDRYIEVWNIVFMQFNRLADGTMEKLPKPSVDTGMGLERMTAVMQHVNSNYEIDIFQKLIAKAAEIVGITDLNNKSLRVIADHIRSCAYLVADGVIPSNEGRGYVLRRIIRRAVRHGHLLGAKEAFFYKLVPTLIEVMEDAGKQVKEKQVNVEKLLRLEEEQFARTLERGLVLLDEALAGVKNGVLSGETAFKLYDTYGFPLDLTADVCRERDIKIDEAGFEREMEAQRLRAQSASQFGMDYNNIIRVEGTTQFEGYTTSETHAKVTALFYDGKAVERIEAGQSAVVILDNTPFYAEMGGQIGDSGNLQNETVYFDVKDTQKYGQVFGHIGELTRGTLSVGQTVNAKVDEQRRQNTALNHSATHLLHSALRQVLGDHVAQKGSLVQEHALRFDFVQPEAISKAQLAEVERLVNFHIRANHPIVTEEMDIESAKAKGAMALFGEKYGDVVRVVSIGDYSIELCGGTHNANSSEVGIFKIISESGVAAGVRRIEALTGRAAYEYLRSQEDTLSSVEKLTKANSTNVIEKVSSLQVEIKKLTKEKEILQQKIANAELNNLVNDIKEVNGVSVLTSVVESENMNHLKQLVDNAKSKLENYVIAFASINEDKVNFVVAVDKAITDKYNAGKLVNVLATVCDGRGGGRPDMAQAGAKNKDNINKAFEELLTNI